MNKHFVFVYGTLRRGSPAAMSIRFPKAKFVADASVSGGLYDLGAYPGLLLEQSSSAVIGEVYEVDEETLNKLDHFEASSDYRRRQVQVFTGTEGRTCWIYVPDHDAELFSQHTLIESGDWMEHAGTKNRPVKKQSG